MSLDTLIAFNCSLSHFVEVVVGVNHILDITIAIGVMITKTTATPTTKNGLYPTHTLLVMQQCEPGNGDQMQAQLPLIGVGDWIKIQFDYLISVCLACFPLYRPSLCILSPRDQQCYTFQWPAQKNIKCGIWKEIKWTKQMAEPIRRLAIDYMPLNGPVIGLNQFGCWQNVYFN